jgi:hypothetical protein
MKLSQVEINAVALVLIIGGLFPFVVGVLYATTGFGKIIILACAMILFLILCSAVIVTALRLLQISEQIEQTNDILKRIAGNTDAAATSLEDLKNNRVSMKEIQPTGQKRVYEIR